MLVNQKSLKCNPIREIKISTSSGQTSVADWVKEIRSAPAPWAELEFDNLIITLHSEFIRQLERPDEVAALWDSIMSGVADLAAKPAKFPRKERFVADVQISYGLYWNLSVAPTYSFKLLTVDRETSGMITD